MIRFSTALFFLSIVGCGVGSDPDSDVLNSEQNIATGTYSFGSVVSSGKCLDVSKSGSTDGTNIQQWTCNGTGAQTFRVEDLGGGLSRLVNTPNGKCVDISAGSKNNGANIQLWTCNGTAAQQFRVTDVGNGNVKFVNPNSDKCIDVARSGTENGTNIQLWTCNGTNAQSFKPASVTSKPTPDPDPGLVWRKADLTNYESYPAPGSPECVQFNGCTWAGQFAALPGKQPESWVKANNIAAVHGKDFEQYKLKTLRLRQSGREIDVKVYDMCADSDCSGCCTANARQTGFLIDIEKYTMERFGSGSGIVEWACLDCR